MPPAPTTKPALRCKFTMPYRGQTKEWSTRFFFTGNAAPTAAQWAAMATNLSVHFLSWLTPRVTWVGNEGTMPGSEVPVWSDSRSSAGSLTGYDLEKVCPGDSAMYIRFSTTQRTSKNHPIYLFNYFHGVTHQGAAPDTIQSEQRAGLADLGAWVTGGSWTDGTNALRKCGPYGAVAQNVFVPTYIGHRDFVN